MNTIKFLKNLVFQKLVYSLWISIITPYPGSKIWEIISKEKLMYYPLGEDFLKNARVNVMFKHPNLTDEEIIYYYKKAFNAIGFNFSHTLYRFSQVRSLDDLRGLILSGMFVLNKMFLRRKKNKL